MNREGGSNVTDDPGSRNHAHVSGVTVIFELTWRGTHTGVLQTAAGEIPATGKRIEIRACQFIEVAFDKARNIRHYFDMATMLAQLGVHTVGA
jgi:predicted ester cyclase